MISSSTIKSQKNGLFSSQILMKKSIVIVDDPFFLDLSSSTRTLRASHGRKPSNTEKKQSRIYTSGIKYPGSAFFAKKLKRLINACLRSVFYKIKSNKQKTILNLNLLNSITKRFIQCAFFTIKFYSQTHKGQRLWQVITGNKRPHLLFQAVTRVVKKQQRNTLVKIIKKYERSKNMSNFLRIFQKIITTEIKFYLKRNILKNIKFIAALYLQRQDATKKLFRIFPKIIKRQKQQAFKKIFDGLKIEELQSISSAKKDVAIKLNQTSVQRARAITTEREQLRGMKNNVQNFSADKNKTKYEIRRDLNVYRNKFKEQEKKANKVISDLSSQVLILGEELADHRRKNLSRISRIQNKIGQENVKKLYKLIQCEQTNSLGQIKLRSISKEELKEFQRKGSELNEIHIYRNEKFRQQIGEYENNSAFKHMGPQEILIHQQNLNLKQMIQNIIFKALDNSIYLQEMRNSLQ